MRFSKILGFIILFIGLGIIGWSLHQVYGVYTLNIEIPEFFATPDSSFNSSGSMDSSLDNQFKSIMKEQLTEFLPVDSISKSLNLGFFSAIIGLFIFGGSKIAFIGVKLVKGNNEVKK